MGDGRPNGISARPPDIEAEHERNEAVITRHLLTGVRELAHGEWVDRRFVESGNAETSGAPDEKGVAEYWRTSGGRANHHG